MLTSQKKWACKGEAPRLVIGGRGSRRERATVGVMPFEGVYYVLGAPVDCAVS